MAAVGSQVVALAAKRHAVPLVVLVGLYKLSPLFPHDPTVTFNDFKVCELRQCPALTLPLASPSHRCLNVPLCWMPTCSADTPTCRALLGASIIAAIRGAGRGAPYDGVLTVGAQGSLYAPVYFMTLLQYQGVQKTGNWLRMASLCCICTSS